MLSRAVAWPRGTDSDRKGMHDERRYLLGDHSSPPNVVRFLLIQCDELLLGRV